MYSNALNKTGQGMFFSAYGKIALVMQLTAILLFTACLQVSAIGYAQKVTIVENNVPLTKIFREIRKQSGYSFIYAKEDIKKAMPVTIVANDVDIRSVLDKCFAHQPLTFLIKNNIIVVRSIPPVPAIPTSFNKKISGQVTDSATGRPLVGVTIQVKDGNAGTVTDAQGNYNLDVPEDGVLIISYIGYIKREIPAAGKSVINVSMSASATGLNQVVVVGYGTQMKQDITGAVSVADLDTYRDVPVNNILETVKGTIPGLNIGGITSAGAVGAISIRGQNSISASSNAPLIVLDGAIYSGSLADISPFDIQSFTVLKDASAAAIYGSRSANGVILIETKGGTGIGGKPKFNVEFDYGISNQLKPLATYGPEGFVKRLLDVRRALNEEADPNKIAIYLQPEEQKNYEATPDHKPTTPRNPVDLLVQPAYNRKASISVSNKTSNTSYYISTTLTDQHGVVLGDNFKHLSTRVNIASDLTDWFNISLKNSYNLQDFSGAAAPIYWGSQFSPWASVYNEDGSYKEFPQTTTSFISPFWGMATDNKDIRNDLNSIVSATVKIPWVQGLSYQVNFGNTLRWTNTQNWYDKNSTITGEGYNGYGSGTSARNYDMLLDNMIHYNRTFLDKHRVNLTLLYSREHNTLEGTTISGQDFENQSLGYYGLRNGQIQKVATSASEVNSLGQMARLTYSYSSRYTVTGTIRRDGYSEFSKNKKWGTFPSVGVNWNITGENFMKEISQIDHLALRVSYGTRGNQSISPYSTLARVSTGYYVFDQPPTSTVLTQYISSFANDNLSWETVTGTDIGIDFNLFKNRVSGSIGLYNKRTRNLLFTLPLPRTSGASSILSNAGEIKNKGIEVDLHTQNINRKDFQWRSDVAFSLNRNKIGELLGTGDLVSAGLFIGKPLNTFYDYRVTGMWQQEDIDNHTIMEGAQAGDYKLEDVNGDGKITSDSDRVFIGSSNPNFSWSWTNTFTYKEFSLMVYLYSVWGGNGHYLSGGNVPYQYAYTGRTDINVPVYDYWTPENTGAVFPRVLYNADARYQGVKYFDRSFVKLQKIALSYDLSRFVRPKGINNLRVTLSADNLLTYAPHWIGLDPETESGLNATSVPSIRTYLLSASFDF